MCTYTTQSEKGASTLDYVVFMLLTSCTLLLFLVHWYYNFLEFFISLSFTLLLYLLPFSHLFVASSLFSLSLLFPQFLQRGRDRERERKGEREGEREEDGSKHVDKSFRDNILHMPLKKDMQ